MNRNTSFQNAYGKIYYSMTNDYMFRAVLQSNNRVLRGLICSLLHLTEQEVVSAKVTNPIILGGVDSRQGDKTGYQCPAEQPNVDQP